MSELSGVVELSTAEAATVSGTGGKQFLFVGSTPGEDRNGNVINRGTNQPQEPSGTIGTMTSKRPHIQISRGRVYTGVRVP